MDVLGGSVLVGAWRASRVRRALTPTGRGDPVAGSRILRADWSRLASGSLAWRAIRGTVVGTVTPLLQGPSVDRDRGDPVTVRAAGVALVGVAVGLATVAVRSALGWTAGLGAVGAGVVGALLALSKDPARALRESRIAGGLRPGD